MAVLRTWRGELPNGISLKVEEHDDGGVHASACDLTEDWSPITRLERVVLEDRS